MSDASTPPITWTPFEHEGRLFEFLAVPTRQKIRPAGWPKHKASPGRSMPVLMLIVRLTTDRRTAGIVLPRGTVVTVEHAVEGATLILTPISE